MDIDHAPLAPLKDGCTLEESVPDAIVAAVAPETGAELLGLAQRDTALAYERRYPTRPRPVALDQGRCKLWLRSEIDWWRADQLASSGR